MATKRDWVWLALTEIKEGRVTVEQVQKKAEELSYNQTVSKDTVRSVLIVLCSNKKCAHEDGSKYYHIRV